MSNNTKLIFLACKYSEPKRFQIERNIARARVYAQEVALMGALPLCPGVIGADMDGTQSYEWWGEAYIQLMRRCDGIFMVPHWESSNGARLEHAEADRLDLPIFYHLSDLKKWLTGTEQSDTTEESDETTPYE
jgi:hypothetical protein